MLLLALVAVLARRPGRTIFPPSPQGPRFTLNGTPAPLEFFDIDTGVVQFYRYRPWLVHLREKRAVYDFRAKDKLLYLGERCIGWSGQAPPGVGQPWAIHQSKLDSPLVCDPETAVSLEETSGQLPPLRYLRLRQSQVQQILPAQPELRFLSVTASKVDVGWLPAASLTHLEIAAGEIANVGLLGEIGGLRYLRLAAPNFRDAGLLASCSNLTTLALDLSSVEDLRPLQGLPRLRSVSAAGCPVRSIPASAPWSHLDLLDSRVSPEDVSRFRGSQPESQVWRLDEDPLLEALQGVDEIQIVDRDRRDRTPAQTLARTQEPADVREFLSTLRFRCSHHLDMLDQYNQDGPHGAVGRGDCPSMLCCACGGGPFLEFYRHGELVLILGNQHGEGVRWPQGPWLGDAGFTPEAQKVYLAWLDAHGVHGPSQEVESARLREEHRK